MNAIKSEMIDIIHEDANEHRGENARQKLVIKRQQTVETVGTNQERLSRDNEGSSSSRER